MIGKNTDLVKLSKTLTTSTPPPISSKLKSTLVQKDKQTVKSDLHDREALGHGVFLVKSRLAEGREIFEKTKVITQIFLNILFGWILLTEIDVIKRKFKISFG